mgnify:CR=1 FL=1
MKLENVLVDPSAASLLEEAKNRFHACSEDETDRKSTRLNSSHSQQSRMPSSA